MLQPLVRGIAVAQQQAHGQPAIVVAHGGNHAVKRRDQHQVCGLALRGHGGCHTGAQAAAHHGDAALWVALLHGVKQGNGIALQVGARGRAVARAIAAVGEGVDAVRRQPLAQQRHRLLHPLGIAAQVDDCVACGGCCHREARCARGIRSGR
ncbi:hypothetical protein D3C72_1284350 [compost metagenome]